jgi:saccharopine dehydrogenase-like NADP-dependent oxidoreductase
VGNGTLHTVLVIGGYGFFGTRIATQLCRNPRVRVLIGGRDALRAGQLARALNLSPEGAVRIDAAACDFAEQLTGLGVRTVVHTAGPFQGQDYAVAEAAVHAGCNYIDLGDGRSFVSGISVLDAVAKARDVSVVSGASSIPALSSAVVDTYQPVFSRLDTIRAGISSGARAPGLATVQGIFGYGGKPFRRLERGEWVETHGWLDLARHDFPAPVGRRLLGSIDVPDLELFPKRYGASTVTFQAGFASGPGHLVVWSLAGLVKLGLLSGMGPLARPMNALSRILEPLISDKGGMFVELEGLDRERRPARRRWHLIAAQNHGPYIPCGASIALVDRLANAGSLPKGAMTCMGLLTVNEYLAPLKELDIKVIADLV